MVRGGRMSVSPGDRRERFERWHGSHAGIARRFARIGGWSGRQGRLVLCRLQCHNRPGSRRIRREPLVDGRPWCRSLGDRLRLSGLSRRWTAQPIEPQAGFGKLGVLDQCLGE